MREPHPEGPRSPDALFRRWRDDGDRAALAALFDATAPELLGIARRIERDPQRAEDAVQEAWLVLLAAPGRFDDGRRVVPWLVGILRHKLLEGWRIAARRVDPRRVRVPSSEDGPERAASRAEEAERVRAALDALPETYREAARLRWRDGLDPSEIARRERRPPATVRSLLARARERLRRGLTPLAAIVPGLPEGPADLQGLARVRRAVLERAGSGSAGAAATVATAMTGGGGIVATKGTVVAVITVAVVGTVFVWLRTNSENATGGDTPTTASAEGASRTVETRRVVSTSGDLASEPAGPRARGRVVDEMGRAVPGATVMVVPYGVKTASFDAAVAAGATDLVRAITGSDGGFEVPLSVNEPLHTLFATAPGHAVAAAAGVADGVEIVVALRRRRDFAGSVRDSAGVPVAGARVVVRRWIDTLVEDRDCRTGEDGGFRIEGVDPGDATLVHAMAVEIEADGFAPFAVGPVRIGGEARGPAPWGGDFTISRGWTVRGVVRNGEGSPVEGARVLAWAASGSATLWAEGGRGVRATAGKRILDEVRSAADGSFSLSGLPSDAETTHLRGQAWDGPRGFRGGVTALAEGLCHDTASLVAGPEGSERIVELVLAPGAALEGRAVDPTGRPVPGAAVRAAVAGVAPRALPEGVGAAMPGAAAVTGADGSFRIPAVRLPGGGAALVAVRGGARIEGSELEGGIEVAVPGAGETTRIGDLVLAPRDAGLPWKDLLVLTAGGRPAWGASVEAEDANGAAIVDRSGRARFRRGKRGKGASEGPVRLLVRLPRHGARRVEVVPSTEPSPPERIVLGPARTVAGRVLHADGSPAAGALVQAFAPTEAPAAVETTGAGRPWQSSKAGPDGRFALADLPPEEVVVVAGGTPGGGAVASAPLAPGAAGDLVLCLPPAESPRTATVAGKVVDESGGAVVRFDAILSGPGGRYLVSRGDDKPDGGFAFDGVPEGRWSLRIDRPGFAPVVVEGIEVAAGVGPPPLAVVLARGVPVSGRARLPAGTRARDVVLRLSPDGAPHSAPSCSSLLDDDGGFHIAGVPPGTYRLALHGAAEAGRGDECLLPLGDGPLVVREGDGRPAYDAEFVRACRVAVVPVDSRLAGGAGDDEASLLRSKTARIVVRGPDGAVLRSRAGVFRGVSNWEALLPGIYELRLEIPGCEPVVESIDLRAARATTVRIGRE